MHFIIGPWTLIWIWIVETVRKIVFYIFHLF